MRLDSYVDGIVVTPVDAITLGSSTGGSKHLAAGQVFVLHSGRMADFQPPIDAAASQAWDTWVAQRYAERTALIDKEMHEAGLTQPVPGLAEMEGGGTFFPCASYGTCWEPAMGWNPQTKPVAPTQPVVSAQSSRSEGSHFQTTSFEACSSHELSAFAQIESQAAFSGYDDPLPFEDEDDFFPCSPYTTRYWL
ncbi:hypothetical protein [Granulicella tundricola]|uniref:Uncharacterized protein n=1 Tax=Granulicella tundricola (strain ATCC BAA-1859 / DSM 23138 / MP5ACTX9) TaxID=1198114 RepID=E8X6G5_GRATM|nr:hypothetical protein [Granulicella tundricola]ADW71049.1 hypothetical protein AciX9_4278 [Granulicella tundricola MP5ACTX9]